MDLIKPYAMFPLHNTEVQFELADMVVEKFLIGCSITDTIGLVILIIPFCENLYRFTRSPR